MLTMSRRFTCDLHIRRALDKFQHLDEYRNLITLVICLCFPRYTPGLVKPEIYRHLFQFTNDLRRTLSPAVCLLMGDFNAHLYDDVSNISEFDRVFRHSVASFETASGIRFPRSYQPTYISGNSSSMIDFICDFDQSVVACQVDYRTVTQHSPITFQFIVRACQGLHGLGRAASCLRVPVYHMISLTRSIMEWLVISTTYFF